MTLHVLYLSAVPAVGGLIAGVALLRHALQQWRTLPTC